MSQQKWIPTIGIEIHAQIKTKSKLFSPDSTNFHSKENQCIHPVSLGFPGTLPYINQEVIRHTINVAKAFHCDIQKQSVFSRKNYFYPDLPKGYQISQFDFPILQNGFVEFFYQEQEQKIQLERIHLEEDAGKLIHQNDCSLVDFNRAGTPLFEIISKPEITSPIQASQYARMVRSILLYLDVCDGNLQEGSMRFDCNISLRTDLKSPLGTKVELKNLNSFRFIEKALQFEINRQSKLLNQGFSIQQETRLFNPKKGETFSMRSKEEASDYRYFPEPDLGFLSIDDSLTPSNIELPFDKIKKLHQLHKLTLLSATLLAEDKDLCHYFESTLAHTQYTHILSNWILNEVLAKLNEEKRWIQDIPISTTQMAHFINYIGDKTLSSKMAKTVFAKMWIQKKDATQIMKELNLRKITDKKILSDLANQVIKNYPQQWKGYREGKEAIYQFLIGQIMKLSKGQADPFQSGEILKKLKSNSNY